jgi:PhnB protein
MATAKRGGKAKKTTAKRGSAAKKAAPKKAAPKRAAAKKAAPKRAAPRRAARATKAPGVPAGFHTITAQLSLDQAGKAIEFYEKALGAEVLDRALDPSGAKVMHAMLRVGDSMLFVNDVFTDMGGTHSHSGLWLYVPDVDASYKRAVDAGATGTQPPADMFWGDRMAHIKDPFGQTWAIATQVKVMTPEEQKAAADAFFKQMAEHHAPPPAQA